MHHSVSRWGEDSAETCMADGRGPVEVASVPLTLCAREIRFLYESAGFGRVGHITEAGTLHRQPFLGQLARSTSQWNEP
jgi:hypothetical protein